MNLQITDQEFANLRSRDFLNLECRFCGNIFQLKKHEIQQIKAGKGAGLFCSLSCSARASRNRQIIQCSQCGNNIERTPSKIGLKNFCSHSCSAKFNNIHKKHGTRRSKLEIYIENQILNNYPNLKLICNDRAIIGAELDFYFPELRLAIELNGILHYEPIYGNDKFEKIQANDSQKIIKCFESGIELCVIDTSTVNYVNNSIKQKYWNLIQELLNSVICRKNQ